MPALYRCRVALSEIADLFDARAPRSARWAGELWPGRQGLVVRQTEAGRRIDTMRWGLAAEWLRRARPGTERANLWFREVNADAPHLLEPAHRCLIILDSFALPEGPDGHRVRCWYGDKADALLAWAGIWNHADPAPGYAGFLVETANEAGRRILPALVAPDDYETWLGGDLEATSMIARRDPRLETLYREPTEERWGGGS